MIYLLYVLLINANTGLTFFLFERRSLKYFKRYKLVGNPKPHNKVLHYLRMVRAHLDPLDGARVLIINAQYRTV